METIITIFTVLSMYMNVIQNADSKYYYNAEIEDGIVKTMYVFDHSGERLQEKLACYYDYDGQGRVTEKTVCRWDSYAKQYAPDYKLHFTYGSDGYELARCEWNAKCGTWNSYNEKIVYQIDNGHLQTVNFLRLDHDGYFRSVDHLNVIDPFEGILLADILL